MKPCKRSKNRFLTNKMDDMFQRQLNAFDFQLSKETLCKINVYLNALIETNKKFNLVSNDDYQTILLDHVADSSSFMLVNLTEYGVNQPFSIVDIGSGAGFPGIIIAILYPESRVTLIESIAKKANFLTETARLIQLKNLTVLPCRAEEAGKNILHREKYDIATARALSNSATLLEYAFPLLKPEGIFISYKTENTVNEIKELSNVLKILGGEFNKALNYDLLHKKIKRTLLIFKKVDKTPLKYPRNVGMPAKKPLK